MHIQIKLLPIIVSINILASCATVNVSERKKIAGDQSLSPVSFANLNGEYANSGDSSKSWEGNCLWKKLFSNVRRVDNWQNATVSLQTIDDKTIEATLLVAGQSVEKRRLSFKLKKGYVNLKRQLLVRFSVVGPIFWAAGDCKIYLGLTRDNDLILMNSGSGSAMFFFIPFFPAGGQMNVEYCRIN